MAELSIRRFRQADSERVQKLHEEAMRDVGSFVEGVPDADLERVETEYLDSNGEFLVGLLDSQIIAMGAFRLVKERFADLFSSLDQPTAEIKRMRVDPAYQRRGHGQQIYDELEKCIQTQGYNEVVLDTDPRQKGARRFYEKNGFTTERRVQVETFDEAFKLLLYRKQIG